MSDERDMIRVHYTLDQPHLIDGKPVFKDQVIEVDPDDPVISNLLETGALVAEEDATPPTRQALAGRAKKLGIKVKDGHSKNDLAEKIAHAEGESRFEKEGIPLPDPDDFSL